MNSFEKLKLAINKTSSYLCVGLDTDIDKVPEKFAKNGAQGLLDFNKAIINATSDLACSYKINFAFYERYGTEGFDLLKKTFEAIPDWSFTVADAKRGDIGNTSASYSKSVFDYFNADSVTVNPYMGFDSIQPFLTSEDKMVFLLALTSNPGSADFQRLVCDGKPVFKHVIHQTSSKIDYKNLGFVVGATHPGELAEIRSEIPNNTLLIPGVGAQGGDIDAVIAANAGGPAVINVSRGIIYPIGAGDFETLVREQAEFYAKALKV